MIELLANTQNDPMISGNWIIAVIGALATAAAGILGKIKGRKEASEERDVTVKPPLPDLEVSKKFTPPTFHQHMALERRVNALETEAKSHREYVEGQLRQIRHDSSEQFVRMMEAGEERKDKMISALNETARSIHARIDQLVTPKK